MNWILDLQRSQTDSMQQALSGRELSEQAGKQIKVEGILGTKNRDERLRQDGCRREESL